MTQHCFTLIALALTCAVGCKLDITNAHNCETAVDCVGGDRVCVQHRCVARSDAPASAKPDGGRAMDSGPEASHAPFEAGQSMMDAEPGQSPGDGGGMHPTHVEAGQSPSDGAVSGKMDAGKMDAGDARVVVMMDDFDGGDDDGGPRPIEACSQHLASAPGVVLWLDAANGVVADSEQRVQTWNDESPVQHIASSTGTAEDWPLLVTHEGHPALRFGLTPQNHARRMSIPDDPTLSLGYDDFGLIAVLRYKNSLETSVNQAGSVYAKVCNCNNYIMGLSLFANDDLDNDPTAPKPEVRSSFYLQMQYGVGARSSATGFNDYRVHVVVAQRSTYRVRVDVDGELHSSWFGGIIDLSGPDSPAVIGANSGADIQALDGDIFELVVVHGTAPETIAGISECLMAKYKR